MCPRCGAHLGNVEILIDDNNEAEVGSINYEKSNPQPMKYTVRLQCWKCDKGDNPVLQPDGKWKRLEPAEVIAEVSNEVKPII